MMTEEDQAEVCCGKSLWLLGSVLAKMLLLFRTFATTEFFVFLVARKDNPYLICDLIIPEQFANSSAVLAPGRAVLRANREARAQGGSIVCAAHSHASMSVFSSSIDVAFMRQLSEEGVGWASLRPVIAEGQVVPQLPAGNAASSALPVFEVLFPDCPGLSLRIAANRPGLSAEDFSASLNYHEPVQVSAFLTLNAAGDRFMPTFKVARCALCRATTHEEATANVKIHLVGPAAIGQQERRELLATAERRAPSRSMPYSPTHQSSGYYARTPAGSAAPFHHQVDQSLDASAPGTSTDFLVWRHGRSHRVLAEVLEEAAYLCPKLAEALGWQEDAAVAGDSSAPVAASMDSSDADRTSEEGTP
jgi:proteasome lid subunit RPN8/RPN11